MALALLWGSREKPIPQEEMTSVLLFKGSESHPRSIVKAISWRVLGSIDTFVLSLLITGSLHLAGAIASIETVTKIVLYYFHERVWSAVKWGREGGTADASAVPGGPV